MRSTGPTASLLWLLFVASTCPAQTAPDLTAIGSTLAATDGGVVDTVGRFSGASLDALQQLVQREGKAGRKLWVILLPETQNLDRALTALGGRLAPKDGEAVIVASPAGLKARVPEFAGASRVIDEAFQESRRELARDLPLGVATFVGRLDDARSGQQRATRLAVAAGILAALVLLGYLVHRFRGFHRTRVRWDREDRAGHDQLVSRCQELLQGLSAPGAVPEDPGFYDRVYGELNALAALPPAEARPGLTLLVETLQKAGRGASGGQTR